MTRRCDHLTKFTERARRVFVYAEEEAQRSGHNYIGTEHLLLGLIHVEEGVAAKVLTSLNVDLGKMRAALEFIVGHGDTPARGEIGLTPRSKKVVKLAVDGARRLKHNYIIGTEHLLMGLVREGEGVAAGVLESFGVNLERVREETARVRRHLGAPSPPAAGSSESRPASTPRSIAVSGEFRTPSLSEVRRWLHSLREEREAAAQRKDREMVAMFRARELRLEQQIQAREAEARASLISIDQAITRAMEASHWSLQQVADFREGLALGLALTGGVRSVLDAAVAEAARLGHSTIRSEHIILALLLPDGPLVRDLQQQGVDIERVRRAVREQIEPRPAPDDAQA